MGEAIAVTANNRGEISSYYTSLSLSARPSDDHVPAPGVCPRCEWDLALYGEAVWDADTGNHLKAAER